MFKIKSSKYFLLGIYILSMNIIFIIKNPINLAYTITINRHIIQERNNAIRDNIIFLDIV